MGRKGRGSLKTTIGLHYYPVDVDLSDIGTMIKRYCNKVERLEEHIEELELENAKLKEQINREVER